MGSQYILYLIIAGVIGLLVGLLLASLFSGNGKNKSEKLPPKELLNAGFVEGTRLLYNPKDKKVITELDGVFQSDFSKLSIDNKKRVFDVLTGLQNWSSPEKAMQVETPAIETSLSEATSPFEETTLFDEKPLVEETAALEETSTPFADYQPAQPFSSAPLETDPITDLQGAFAESEAGLETEKIVTEPVVKKNLSIAEQISAILEDMIKDTDYKEKGIKLIENQENGVDVWVGLEKYSGIENVPYPEVQQLIRTAAKRWEQEVDNQQKYQS